MDRNTDVKLAYHVSDSLFEHFDQKFLGSYCESIGAEDEAIRLCKLGFYFCEKSISPKIMLGKYEYLVEINVEDAALEYVRLDELLEKYEGGDEDLDKADIIVVDDQEFDCWTYLVRPWALDRVVIKSVRER